MARYYGGFAPYVRVADRKKAAAKKMAALKKKGQDVQPVVIEGRQIAKTFWGKAWCEHLESCCDYDNRLPRGRTYVRNGSVLDLQISSGEIKALVSGSSIYKINITIKPLSTPKWQVITKECAGEISSVVELLQGKFSNNVMKMITHPEKGLFPHIKEIDLNCSCPDWATMCKHVAAVLYGVGARLDENPEALFLLRKTDHLELIATAGTTSLTKKSKTSKAGLLENSDLSALFGIDLDTAAKPAKKQVVKKPVAKKATAKKIIAKKPIAKTKVSLKKKATVLTTTSKKTTSKKAASPAKTTKKTRTTP